ncbi:unnamed protein product [Rotaria socialis]|uniref:Transposase n=1 Tax=Rotaria socialis TaxID=392032 RepID=A0A820S158_9BILA|nr:unnamed protein product [Rotaria socialis]CAF4514237.1 unnamed protein product [Rotaria socialis]
MVEKKKFDACLLRTEADIFIVAEWHQIVTAADKSKLRVGSIVGFKRSQKTREKIIRGTIVVTGKLSVCEQQQKLLTSKAKKKKAPATTFDDEDESEDEMEDFSTDRNLSNSKDENSSESNDDCLHIDEEEEISNDRCSNGKQVDLMNVAEVRDKNSTANTHTTSSNAESVQDKETTNTAHSNKRLSYDDKNEHPVQKKKCVLSSSLDELRAENSRLKKQIEMYKNEWMPRPTDPGVIRYFTRMVGIFSCNGEDDESKGDKLVRICNDLNMEERQLIRLQKENGTKTARAIVRAYYPAAVRNEIKPEEIDDNFRNAIHVKECEQLNEDLALMNEPNNFADEFDNDVTSSSDEAPINFDNISLLSLISETAAKSCTSEHEQHTINSSNASSTRSIEKVDLAAALVSLKTRHSLSAVCINDLCSLLCLLNVHDAPRSWFHVKKALNKSFGSTLDRTIWFVCPSCKKASDNAFSCSSVSCDWCFAPPASLPTYFYIFNIHEQLNSILAITTDVHLSQCSNRTSPLNFQMRDIIHGDQYQKLLHEQSDDILTLTMSTDGIQPFNCSEKSIWPVTFVINEVKRKKRFCFQNLILGGVWPGPAKPKRFEMSAFLETIIVQLKELEKGYHFRCRLSAGYVTRFFKVFLICACMDKPAQALVQNLPEPTAKFGCGRCEIRGYTVRSSVGSDHCINCFPIKKSAIQPNLRSNDRHDHLVMIKEKNDADIAKITSRRLGRIAKRQLKQKIAENKQSEYGILGPCILRQLKYFDVGFSFLSDNLHNVYHGVFRKLLNLWLKSNYKKEDWSCYYYHDELSSMLQSFRFPSTTSRRPRSLLKFKKLKANELRMVLLFGFVIFKNALNAKYYNHFLKLVFAMYFSENRCVTAAMIGNIKSLLHEFLIEFPKLYTVRHNQQVVHSLNHIGQTVNDYGPLTSYSTFHFESNLGMIMRTIKGTRREEIEMIGNLNTFRSACFHLQDSTINDDIRSYIEKLLYGRGYYASSTYTAKTIHSTGAVERISNLFSNQKLRFFSSYKIGRVRYTTVDYSNTKVVDDSAVLFQVNGEIHFGLINSIFTDDDDETLVEVWPLSNPKDFYILINGKKIDMPSIQEGKLEKNDNFYYVSACDIIEKCVYWRNKSNDFIFFRYPNLEESS